MNAVEYLDMLINYIDKRFENERIEHQNLIRVTWDIKTQSHDTLARALDSLKKLLWNVTNQISDWCSRIPSKTSGLLKKLRQDYKTFIEESRTRLRTKNMEFCQQGSRLASVLSRLEK